MDGLRRLIGVFVCVLGATVPAYADVVTDWSAITISTIGAAAPVPGPARLIEYAMVHIAMHDAVQAIQQRFETYSPGITPTTGSVIAAAAKAARDVLVNRFRNRRPRSIPPTRTTSRIIRSRATMGA